VHLVFNIFALAYIGILLEKRLGKFNFIFTYLIAGIVASATSMWHSGYVASVGASGAIFGIYGIFLALLTTNYIEKAVRKALFSSIAVFIMYNLIGRLNGSIDNAAHVGGLLCGFLMGYLLIPSLILLHLNSEPLHLLAFWF
jgi:rhomboid protease GluP